MSGTIFSRTSIISWNFYLDILYPEAIWAKSLASWFSFLDICFMSATSKYSNSCVAITKNLNKFSLMHLYSRVTCLITNSESPLNSTQMASNPFKSRRPIIRASYSASLLEHFSLILHLNLVGPSCGDNINTPTPILSLWIDPSKYNRYVLVSTTFSDG